MAFCRVARLLDVVGALLPGSSGPLEVAPVGVRSHETRNRRCSVKCSCLSALEYLASLNAFMPWIIWQSSSHGVMVLVLSHPSKG